MIVDVEQCVDSVSGKMDDWPQRLKLNDNTTEALAPVGSRKGVSVSQASALDSWQSCNFFQKPLQKSWGLHRHYSLSLSRERIPKDSLYGELVTGKRPTGRPQLRYKDTCKRRPQTTDTDTWEVAAADRSTWNLTTGRAQGSLSL